MKKLVLHHVSLMAGYVGVGKSITLPYDGRFGKGKKVLLHNDKSTRYCICQYWIYKED